MFKRQTYCIRFWDAPYIHYAATCEAQAVKPDKPVKPKRIDSEPRIVRYPLRHDARLLRPAYWEPLDCKLNDCSDYEEDDL